MTGIRAGVPVNAALDDAFTAQVTAAREAWELPDVTVRVISD